METRGVSFLLNRKLQLARIEDGINQAAVLFPERKIIVLHDDAKNVQELAAARTEILFVPCHLRKPEVISRYDPNKTIFIYSCSYSFNGIDFIKAIIARRGNFVTAHVPEEWGTYLDQDKNVFDMMNFEFKRQYAEGYMKIDTSDMIHLCQVLERTRHLRGDYIEIGCYRGSSGSGVLNYMGRIGLGRRCWFLDVFEGFNYEAAKISVDAGWVGGHVVTEGEGAVQKRLERYARPEIGLEVRIKKSNIITDKLPDEISEIVVANVDVDMYEAVAAALRKVRERLVPGGIIMVEDVSHTPALIGSLVALEEFMESPYGQNLFRFQLDRAQTMLIDMR